MEITSEQITMLTELSTVIRLKLGYKIGYTHPCGSFTSPEDDFVIFDRWGKEDADYLGLTDALHPPQLVAREDSARHMVDVDFSIEDENGKRATALPIGVVEKPNQFCLHDAKVEALLKEINDALMTGKIFFDPEIERKIGYKTYKIKKRADDRFNVRVIDDVGETGFTRTIKELQKYTELDSRDYCRQALDFIKEEWPESL